MTDDLWDNRYTGPRFTYAYRNRPSGPGCQPKGFILMTWRDHPGYRHGTVDYPRKLTDQEVYDYELVLVGESTGDALGGGGQSG